MNKSPYVLLNCNNKIKALLDFHEMAAWRKEDICIGINDGKYIIGSNGIIPDDININDIKNKYENVL